MEEELTEFVCSNIIDVTQIIFHFNLKLLLL